MTIADAFAQLALQEEAMKGLAPEDLELEAQLFARRSGAGESLAALEISVTVESPERVVPCSNFRDAALHPVVLSNMQKSGILQPTAIQGYCIPAVLSGKDVVAVAQTGSGKTAAYLAPIISKLMGRVDIIGGPRVDTTKDDYNPLLDRVRAEPLVMIICPTRELALQMFEEARRLSYRSKLRVANAYGGLPVVLNLQQLSKGCDILIGTPGRLVDMLDRPDVLSLCRIQFTVLDEADEIIGKTDWEETMSKLLGASDANEDADHHYLMFSATFPKEARKVARQYLQEDHVRIRVGRAGSSHKNVEQDIVWVDGRSKMTALLDLLGEKPLESVLIFCNSIQAVERVDAELLRKDLGVTFIHGNRPQLEREDALRSFHLKKTPILVTTALSARGIDFDTVQLVINFDMPSNDHGGIDEYVHRIGRTGRIGHVGKAISFYNERDEGLGPALTKILQETRQTVPDFLSQYVTEGDELDFADDTGSEDEEEDAAAGGDAWGNGGGDAGGDGDGWGGGDEKANEADNETNGIHPEQNGKAVAAAPEESFEMSKETEDGW